MLAPATSGRVRLSHSRPGLYSYPRTYSDAWDVQTAARECAYKFVKYWLAYRWPSLAGPLENRRKWNAVAYRGAFPASCLSTMTPCPFSPPPPLAHTRACPRPPLRSALLCPALLAALSIFLFRFCPTNEMLLCFWRRAALQL